MKSLTETRTQGLTIKMKISKKLQKAISGALMDAAIKVANDRAPETENNAPEMWNDRDKEIFDTAHDVEMEARLRLRELGVLMENSALCDGGKETHDAEEK